MKKLMCAFVRSLLCGMLPVALLLGGVPVSAYTGSSAKELTAGADIRVMSYNVLVDNDESLGGWSWGQALGNRGNKASAAINYYRPDVIGFQECNYKWHVSLRENLPDYDFVNADVPEQQKLEASASLGKKDWMCTTMMYNTKTLKLVENELIGYSCNYWGCIQRMRYISMAVFEVKATGERFVFTSTHLDAERDEKGKKMRRTQATELANRINYYKETYGCPVISTGDYNTGYNDEPISIVRDIAAMTSHTNNRGGIDYVLYSQGVTGKYFTVVGDSDLAGASDHQPIFADLALDNGFHFPTTKATTTTTTEAPTTTTTTTTTVTTTQSTVFRPTGFTHPQATEDTTLTTDSVVVDPVAPTVADGTTAPTQSADITTSIGSAIETTPTILNATESLPITTQPQPENAPVEAKPVKKGNDKLIYVGIAAAAAVAVGAVVTLFLLRKKK